MMAVRLPLRRGCPQLGDPRIRLISQENQGAQVARNVGIRNAQGEYIALLDSDDIWDITKLEKQVQYLNRHADVGVVYTWTSLIDAHGTPLKRVVASHLEGNVWPDMVVRDTMLCSGSVAMVRRHCFETVGLFDESLSGFQDWDMGIRLAQRYQFGVVKEVLTFYRHHQQSMSKCRSRKMTRQTSLEVIDKAFRSAPPELLYLKQKSYCCVNLSQAWLCVDQGNWVEATRNLIHALAQYPQIIMSEYCLRLMVAIAMTTILGPGGYTSLRKVSHQMRLWILGVHQQALWSPDQAKV